MTMRCASRSTLTRTLELRVAETDPGADGTDLYMALQSAMSDAPRERIAGAILITDGQIHDAPANADDAKPMGPVHALIVGGDDEIDRNIEIQQAPSFSIIDQKVEMRVQVNDPTRRLCRSTSRSMARSSLRRA
jgi:hypothetical protein